MSVMPLVDYALDKDILSPSIKVYSSSTCCLAPVEINQAIKGLTSRVRDDKLITLKLNSRNI